MNLYVDVHAGRDGNGTEKMPFRRINEAAKVAKPGDTVLVAPGVYREYVDPILQESQMHVLHIRVQSH